MLREIFIGDSLLNVRKDTPKKHMPEWWQRGNWMSQTIPWPHHSYFLRVWGEKIRCERISQANKPEKTFLKDLCLGLLSDTLWWALLWWARTFLIPGPTQPLPRQQRKTCTCIPAVSLVWHTNAKYFNKPTKACEIGWSWPEDQALFPPLPPLQHSYDSF